MNQSAFIRRIARTTGLPQTVTDSILKAAAGVLANPETRTVGGKRRARFRASSAFAAAVEFRKD